MNLLPPGFEEVFGAVLDGTADDGQRRQFRQWLKDRPELLDAYIDQGEVHAALLMIAGTGNEAEPAHTAKTGAVRIWGKGWCRAAAAAAVLGGAALLVRGVPRETGNAATRQPSASQEVPLIRVTRQWEASGLKIPESLPGNVRLGSGSARIRLPSGVELLLRGPVELLVESGMETRLRAGELLAWVPKRASGFTVHAPGLTAWDIGTIFSVTADSAGSSLFVFKGSVQALDGTGAAIDFCAEGEGVLALASRTPVKVMADAAGTRELFCTVRGERAWTDPSSTFAVARKITLEWNKQCLPAVRPDSTPISEEVEMSSRVSQTMTSAMLALTIVSAADAQTAWKSPADGLWTNAAAWTAGVPEGNAALLTNTAASYAVTVDATPATPFGNLIVSNATENTTRLNVNAAGFNSTNGVFVFERGSEIVVNSGGVMGYSGRPAAASDSVPFVQIREGGVWRVDGGGVNFSNIRRTTASSGNNWVCVGSGSRGRLEVNSGAFNLIGATNAENGTVENNSTALLRVGYGANGYGELVVSNGSMCISAPTSTADQNREALNVGCGGAGAYGSVLFTGTAVVGITNSIAIAASRNAGAVTGVVEIAGNAKVGVGSYGNSGITVGRFGGPVLGTLTIRENGSLVGGNATGVGVGYESGNGVINLLDNGTLTTGYGGIQLSDRGGAGTSVLNISGNARINECYSGFGFEAAWGDKVTVNKKSIVAINMSGGSINLTAGWRTVTDPGGFLMAKNTQPGSVAEATLNLSGGAITNTGTFAMGVGGPCATGIVNQIGGAVYHKGDFGFVIGAAGGYARYSLSGGRVDSLRGVYVGGVTTNELATSTSTVLCSAADFSAIGILRIDGGEFNIATTATTTPGYKRNSLCVGYNGSGTVIVGSNGVCVADNIVLSNQVQSVVRFEFGKQGIGTLAARKKLAIAAGAKLKVDTTAYEGEARWVKLIDCSTREGSFAAENITVTGGGVVVQDKDEDIWLQKSRGTVIQLL